MRVSDANHAAFDKKLAVRGCCTVTFRWRSGGVCRLFVFYWRWGLSSPYVVLAFSAAPVVFGSDGGTNSLAAGGLMASQSNYESPNALKR